jgi:choline dehydrogenase-like flavoprotein
MTPEIIASNSATADFVRNNCGTIYHPVGTARMGPDSDKEAVVDQTAGSAESRNFASSTHR